MNISLIEKFKELPKELINLIINYTDIVVYRNGKYMNRINLSDFKYNLLKKISRPVFIGKNKILLKLINIDLVGYFLLYDVRELYIKLNIRFFIREIDGFDSYYNIKSNNTYILDSNNRWCKIFRFKQVHTV